MRTTDAIKVDATYRYIRKAQTLRDTIRRRMEWYIKHCPTNVTPKHTLSAKSVLDDLDLENAAERPLWKINAYLCVYTPILKLPTKQILSTLFENLPEPKKGQPRDHEAKIIELMNLRLQKTNADTQRFLLMLETAYRTKHDWFLVFNTLTVAEGQYNAVFKRKSRAFADYIRRVDRAAASAAFGSIRRAQCQDYHTYFAATESGSLHGRLHIHCLHLFKRPPKGSSDPNYGKTTPDRTLLTTMQQYWPHGISRPIIVRYSPQDAWGKEGYRWPIDPATREPKQVKSPLAIANYISKYINKGYNSCQRSKLMWRVKKTQKLGHSLLNELSRSLKTKTLLTIQANDTLRAKLNNLRIPQPLLRQTSLRSLRDRLSTESINDFRSLTDLCKLSTPRLSPLHYSRASIPTILMNNQQSTTFTQTFSINNEATYKEAWLDLWQNIRKMNDKYFRNSPGPTGTADTTDHIYAAPRPNAGASHKSRDRAASTHKNATGQF